MIPRRPWSTHHLVLDLCARLRFACEAIGPKGIHPADVRLDDLAPAQRARLWIYAQQDLWDIINDEHRARGPDDPPRVPRAARSTAKRLRATPAEKPRPRARKRRRGAA